MKCATEFENLRLLATLQVWSSKMGHEANFGG